ncbi:MAG: DEAD/DEAH box helicase [Spirochaetes bacterium]|nr:DEAD/DEAH box helicase [Spirochaetota bacterium]
MTNRDKNSIKTASDDNKKALELFHPLIREWFTQNIGTPTGIQSMTWPVVADKKHVLVTAPTGSGKTLTAFLWGINQLVSGAWPCGQVRILYISPLKALNNDIQRNLIKPLYELENYFSGKGVKFPAIRVLTRSGDTPGDERQKMLRRPPEILITTPESFNILLTSKSGRNLFTGITTVILDEIHAVIANKRGTHMITAVDRLVLLSGEFQRIALSATVRPLKDVADFAGGYIYSENDRSYHSREVSIVTSDDTKKYEIKVIKPDKIVHESSLQNDDTQWPALISECKNIIKSHNSTLFFTNTRRYAEKITGLLNENEPEELAYAHHGSLSREIRLTVEQKLKNGELKAIVATNSLELGIDIGHLDQVVLIESPQSISSAIQRLGRSGHEVGKISKGALFPLYGRDFLVSAVIAKAIIGHEIEPVKIIQNPLDILAQIVLSMTIAEKWDIDELYVFLKSIYPYHNLERDHFELVIEMLAGRFENSRIRELKPRVYIDRIDNTIQARENSAFLIYMSGGTIANRGYFDLRLQDSKAKIGELDEEFVWERTIGETFSLGTQVWQIQKITHNDVEVSPSKAQPGIIPFWKAEQQNKDFFLAEKIGLFLENADKNLKKPEFFNDLKTTYKMDDIAAESLIDFLVRQKAATNSSLPNRHNLLIEHFDDPFNQTNKKQVILHTFWGGKINHPYAIAISAVWQETFNYKLEVIHTNDAILLILPHSFTAKDILSLITPENSEKYLQKGLESTGLFGARFRENAECALLLPKTSFRKRMPLWMNRLRSKKILQAVKRYEEFPVIIETWRSCLRDEFDLDNLKNLLYELQEGIITVTESITTTPSPFTGDLIYKQINKYMYEDDQLPSSGKSSLSDDLIKQLLQSSHLRPKIPEEIIQSLDLKLKRTAQGYTPASSPELLDWIKERILIPENEWNDLVNAVEYDSPDQSKFFISEIQNKILWIKTENSETNFLTAVETLPRLYQIFPGLAVIETGEALEQAGFSQKAGWSLSEFLFQWLSYYGPLELEYIQELFALDSGALSSAVEELLEDQKIVLDRFGENSTKEEICYSDNLEILLRILRKSRQPAFDSLPVEKLQLFIAQFQGLAPKGTNLEDLQHRLEQLFGWPASSADWEGYLLPARVKPYFTAWMDSLMQTSDLIWFGCGKDKISMSFEQDIELFRNPEAKTFAEVNEIFANSGRYNFFDITRLTGLDTNGTAQKIWNLAWKGGISNDTFQALRKGILNNFSAESKNTASYERKNINRWKSARPMDGHWFRIEYSSEKKDILEQEELTKDRIRQLFKRYGIIFRELLAHELPPMQWKNIFRNLRLMEFSGEILSGHFFKGIPGLQFMSHEAYRMIQNPLAEDSVFWINAKDPASLCGVQLESLKSYLPSRISSSFLVYEGQRIVIIIKKNGKNIEILVEPDHPKLNEYLEIFKDLLGREFNPAGRIVIEKINNASAVSSPYTQTLRQFGFRSNGIALELWKGINS